MIVDNDPTTLRSLSLIFEKEYEVESFGDGEGAMKRLVQSSFDLVITDLFVNEVTGLDLYQVARDKKHFIIITGYPEEGLAQQARDILRERFVPKSMAPEALKEAVEKLMR